MSDDLINVLFQVLYVCLGTPAGYVSARIYKSKSKISLCWNKWILGDH